MISPEDIQRIVAEVVGVLETRGATGDDPDADHDAVQDWLLRNEISEDTTDRLVDTMVYLTVHEAGDDPLSSLKATILMAFMIGWETSKQYGRNPA